MKKSDKVILIIILSLPFIFYGLFFWSLSSLVEQDFEADAIVRFGDKLCGIEKLSGSLRLKCYTKHYNDRYIIADGDVFKYIDDKENKTVYLISENGDKTRYYVLNYKTKKYMEYKTHEELDDNLKEIFDTKNLIRMSLFNKEKN